MISIHRSIERGSGRAGLPDNQRVRDTILSITQEAVVTLRWFGAEGLHDFTVACHQAGHQQRPQRLSSFKP